MALQDITLLIPTYKRQLYLKRIVSFYENYPIKLIIADGTEDFAWHGVDKLNKQITYLHLPGASINKRLILAMSNVQTQYSALLGDDEFQLPAGLKYSADILNRDSSISSAIGRCVGFNVTKNGIVGGEIYGYKSKLYPNNLAKRIESFFLHYSPTTAYALWKSADLFNAINIACAEEWASGNAFEIIQAFCGICSGNHQIHEVVQWLRSDEIPPQQAQLNRSLNITEWWRSDKFKNDRAKLVKLLRSLVCTTINCNSDQADTLINLAFEFQIFSDYQNKNLISCGLKPKKYYNRSYNILLKNIMLDSKNYNKSEIDHLINCIAMTHQH